MRLPLLFVSCVFVVGCGSITYDDGTQHSDEVIAARGHGCPYARRHHRAYGARAYAYAPPPVMYAPAPPPAAYPPPPVYAPQPAPPPVYTPPPAPPQVYVPQPAPPQDPRVLVLPPPATAPLPPLAVQPPPVFARPMAPMAPAAPGAPISCGGNQRIRVTDQRIVSRHGPAITASGNCVVEISESIILGRPAVHATGNAQVQIVESRVRGHLLSAGGARIDLRGSQHRGRIYQMGMRSIY